MNLLKLIFFKNVKEIERIQLRFFKRILGVHSKTTNLAIYAELGKVPLINKISTFVVKYWFRISSTYFNNTLVGEARNVCLSMNQKPIIFIKYLLKMCKIEIKDLKEFSYSSIGWSKARGDFCHYLNNILNDEFNILWKDQIHQNGDSGKLKIYKKLKTNISFENYLLEFKNFKHRQAVTKLRVSAHKLPVETGRYKKVVYSDRRCKHCDQNEVGNEEHYLMSCSNAMFVSLRQNFVNSLFKINKSFESFDTQSLFQYILCMKDGIICQVLL